MTVASYGPIEVGSSVVLGTHTGWTGPDGYGGTVTDYTWWAPEMAAYVGTRTVVTSPGIRRSSSRPKAIAAWRMSVKVQRGSIRT